MRRKVIETLFFSKGSQMTLEEKAELKWCRSFLQLKYDDDEKYDLRFHIRSAAVPPQFEPCTYVCGYPPQVFSKIQFISKKLNEEKIEEKIEPAVIHSKPKAVVRKKANVSQ